MRCRSTLAILLLSTIGATAQTPPRSEKPLFNPQRQTLYTQSELWKGFNPATNTLGWDAAVYQQYVRTGKLYPTPQMSRARSLHDDAIAAALRDYTLHQQKLGHLIAAVMGNALEDERCTPVYRKTAILGYQLAKAGYIVSTGGGPGEMEAANLGAYLSNRDESTIDEAIAIFRKSATPNPDPTICAYTSNIAYAGAALDVVKHFPNGAENLSAPTWFYGHEPPNAFATHVAKFFSNAIREDILLSSATGTVIFTEGRAGLRQEIFQKAAQNDFASFCTVVPLVFLGTKSFGDTGLYGLALKFAAPPLAVSTGFANSLKLTDSVAEAIAFIQATPPRRVEDPSGACRNVP